MAYYSTVQEIEQAIARAWTHTESPAGVTIRPGDWIELESITRAALRLRGSCLLTPDACLAYIDAAIAAVTGRGYEL